MIGILPHKPSPIGRCERPIPGCFVVVNAAQHAIAARAHEACRNHCSVSIEKGLARPLWSGEAGPSTPPRVASRGSNG
jgi:hypothetical protein